MKKIFRIFKEFNKADQQLNVAIKEKKSLNRKKKQLPNSEVAEDLGQILSQIYK